MSCEDESRPKSMSRATEWTAQVENLFRFQLAGYRDEVEYSHVHQGAAVDRWPQSGFVKKLQRRDDTFYYYDRKRECPDEEVHEVIVFTY